MEITVKYFGVIADITQKKNEVFYLDSEFETIKSLQSKIEIMYDKILVIKYSLSLNRSIVANCDVVLNDKDEVAFLPPFAGG